MLQRLLPAILLASLATAAMAQAPVITATGVNPVVGDKFQLVVCDPTGVTPGPSGPNQTWTFALTTTQTDTGKARSCAITTPDCTAFPGSNIVMTGPALINAKTYISTSASKRSQIGFYAAADSNLVLSDPMDELHFPFTYLDNYIDAFAGIFTFGPITAHHFGVINVNADAWGKLVLPGRTDLNVLRVHSSQTFKDSAYIFGPVVQDYTINTYAWYKEGYRSALLSISTVTSSTSTQQFVVYAPVYIAGISSLGHVSSFDLYPNPATSQLNVSFEAIGNEPVTISLTDVLGRSEIIASGEYPGLHTISYNTGSLPRGMYLVRLQAGAETITKKVELQ